MSSVKLDWTNAEQANGRKLANWCRANNVVPYNIDAYRKWERGQNPLIDTVDKLMVYNYRHICELPDEIWMEPNNGRFAKGNG